MKRNILLIAGLLVLTFSVGAHAFPAAHYKYSGKIVMIDPKQELFIVKGREGEKAFHANQKTEITINGERKLFGELQKGEDVNVTYTSVNHSRMASQVSMGTSKHS
ncbi:MAG TPA: hypothetical protein VLH08_04355 [Acidobacteriota bacterium]|nr:hypothetical protein [Acidobacteriota bacterium]